MDKKYICHQCGAKYAKPSALAEHRRIWGHHDIFPCDVCHKTFSREDNLRQHRLKHDNTSYHECGDCHQVFNRPDSLELHRERHHSQTGGGRKRRSTSPQPGPSNKKKVTNYDNPSDMYTIQAMDEHFMPKFRTSSTRYRVTFKDLNVRNLPNIMKILQKLFTSIIRDLTEFMNSSDLVRFSVQCPQLDFPINLPFMRLGQLTADRFLSEVERVLQSYEEFVLDESLDIDIIHVSLPKGGTQKKCKYVDLERMMKDKRCFIRIVNDDDLCCARALVTAKALLDNDERWNSIRQGRKVQGKLAEDLHRLAGVPFRRCNIEDIKQFQSVLPDYQIHVLSKESFNAIIFQGPEADKKIYLYHHDDHYDVITKMAAFFNKNFFCTKCNRGYDRKEKHACNNICHCCRRIHDDSTEEWTFCSDCNRYFKNAECFNLHKTTTLPGRNTCSTYYVCKTCSQTVNTKMHRRPHECGEKYCTVCKDYVDQEHRCYMQPEIKEDESSKLEDDNFTKPKAYIFFDFECTQDEVFQCQKGYVKREESKVCINCKQSRCGTHRHIPNLCIAHKVCEICMNQDVNEDSHCSNCGKNERIFRGQNTRDDFCKWLFSEDNTGVTVFCHNFKGYDSYPVMSYLYENAILPSVIMSGSKFMSIDVPHCKIRFLDSMNFIPMALEKMPKTFGISELAKGYFPHLYNTFANQGTCIPYLPDLSYYNPDGMKPEKRNAFLQWYKENQNTIFDLQKELLKYCRSDVDILRRCCLRFQRIFIEMTEKDDKPGIDPFEKCITIASACQLVFRRNFLQENTVGIIPTHGYNPEQKHSVKALSWIKYLSHKNGVKIQHARNGGEKTIGPYKVDGYYETENGDKIVLEFHGDFWHGNPNCYSSSTVNPVRGLTMGELYQETLDKQRFLESKGYRYVYMWEKDYDKELNSNEEMREYISSLETVPPIAPRDAFFGGRTEAFNLYAQADGETKIKYFDVTSLYPFINKTGKIPLGHPEIITEHFSSIDNYEGLIKCKVLPPRNLFIPVLPTRINGKLLFGLCNKCMEKQQAENCQHDQNERAVTGTWVTDEVKKALEKGYEIVKIYEVWHFKNISQYDPESKSGGIFTEYVNTFLKMKQEASGWPSSCNTEAERWQYINDYERKEGIRLEYEHIKQNPGMRAIGKLMLNSFWGKFGQRQNLPQTEYVDKADRYFSLLTSDSQQVTDVSFVNDDMVLIQWMNDENFIEQSGKVNVIIAAYTTAQARLKLYSYLEQLDRRAVYADTDSVVFLSRPGEWEPPLDCYLGGMTDEVAENEIDTFVTGGPKNYAYRLKTPSKDGVSTCCKIRGITLNYKNFCEINFETILQMVTANKKEKITIVDDYKIARDKKTMNLITKSEEKDYKIVFDKRVLRGYTSVPYGM